MAKKTTKSGSGFSINKASFYLLVATAIVYLVAMILSLCNVNLKIVSALQGVASALMIGVVAYIAWRYIKNKPTVWKVLYIVVLLVILACIVVPLLV
mgnify:CR=1 FL=1